jgi:hypothetical protein
MDAMISAHAGWQKIVTLSLSGISSCDTVRTRTRVLHTYSTIKMPTPTDLMVQNEIQALAFIKETGKGLQAGSIHESDAFKFYRRPEGSAYIVQFLRGPGDPAVSLTCSA